MTQRMRSPCPLRRAQRARSLVVEDHAHAAHAPLSSEARRSARAACCAGGEAGGRVRSACMAALLDGGANSAALLGCGGGATRARMLHRRGQPGHRASTCNPVSFQLRAARFFWMPQLASRCITAEHARLLRTAEPAPRDAHRHRCRRALTSPTTDGAAGRPRSRAYGRGAARPAGASPSTSPARRPTTRMPGRIARRGSRPQGLDVGCS